MTQYKRSFRIRIRYKQKGKLLHDSNIQTRYSTNSKMYFLTQLAFNFNLLKSFNIDKVYDDSILLDSLRRCLALVL